jgi:hypothetical protein
MPNLYFLDSNTFFWVRCFSMSTTKFLTLRTIDITYRITGQKKFKCGQLGSIQLVYSILILYLYLIGYGLNIYFYFI